MTILQVDAREMKWPGPLRLLKRGFQQAREGDTIELLATTCAIESVARAWCERDANRAIRVQHDPTGVHIVSIKIVENGHSE